MDPKGYLLAAKAEERHWWFKGRRKVLRSVLEREFRRGDGTRTILEVGCGNGGNLPMLAAYGRVYATELDDDARTRATQRGIGCVAKGWLPDGIPFEGERFDLIAAFDVIEHVEDDASSMAALRSRLKPGGQILLTVPAYPWLWSGHDRLSHHKRRYTRSTLVALVSGAGLRVTYSSYFNTLLFPLAVARIKLQDRLGGEEYSALRIPPSPLNYALAAVFGAERLLVPAFSLPFGVSIVLCAECGE